MPSDEEDFVRLEKKVDRLTDAINKLVLVEERQTNQGLRIGAVEQRMVAVETAQQGTDRKVEMWINRGIGVWALVATLLALFKVFR